MITPSNVLFATPTVPHAFFASHGPSFFQSTRKRKSARWRAAASRSLRLLEVPVIHEHPHPGRLRDGGERLRGRCCHAVLGDSEVLRDGHKNTGGKR